MFDVDWLQNTWLRNMGKELSEDVFAAMPPFELVKALLVKCVQRRDRKKTVRKVLFIDVSKAHLYAPVGEGLLHATVA